MFRLRRRGILWIGPFIRAEGKQTHTHTHTTHYQSIIQSIQFKKYLYVVPRYVLILFDSEGVLHVQKNKTVTPLPYFSRSAL